MKEFFKSENTYYKIEPAFHSEFFCYDLTELKFNDKNVDHRKSAAGEGQVSLIRIISIPISEEEFFAACLSAANVLCERVEA